jgi:hypothetical protein
MTMHPAAEREIPMEARMAQLEQLVHGQQDVIARQQERIEQLEGRTMARQEHADLAVVTAPSMEHALPARSRRALLKLGGAAAVASVAAVATELGHPGTALAAPGTFSDSGAGHIACSGTGSSAAIGVEGISDLSFGMLAQSTSGHGLQSTSSSGIGVIGNSTSNNGVVGNSTSNSGVVGNSTNAYGGSFIGGLAPLRLGLGGSLGAPSAGMHAAGEVYLDNAATVWVCIGGGMPGTWVRLASVANGVPGGAVNFLTHPIRLFDSRPGQIPPAPLPAVKARVPADTTQTMQVTGTVVGGLSVPAGATGVIANATAVSTGGPGFLAFWPHGAPFPGVSNIDYIGGQTLANFCIVGLDANGRMDYAAAGGSDADMLFDVAGYVL